MFEARDSSGSAIQLLTQYPRLAVDYRVETVDEDDRVTLVEKAYYFLAKRGSLLTVHKERQVHHSIEKLCGIYRPLS